MRPTLHASGQTNASAATLVLVAGDDGVPARVREELAAAGATTTSLCSTDDCRAARSAMRAGARVVIGDPRQLETWDQAGLVDAAAVGLLGPDDLENLDAALLVAERAEHARVVVRLFAGDLAGGVERLLGGRGTVLSETDVAAPAFLQAALEGNEGQRVELAGRTLEVDEVDPHDPRMLVALCRADTPSDVLPARDQLDGAPVLGLVDPTAVVRGARGSLPVHIARERRAVQAERETAPSADAPLAGRLRSPRRDAAARARPHDPPGPRRSLATRARTWSHLVPGRAYLLAALILLTGSIATTTFVVADHLSLVDAVYFSATTMATVGYGDVNLADAPGWLKLFDVGFMAVSAVLLASTLAVITDVVVTSRIDRALGRFPRPRQDHVVVCGLGKAGSRIIEGLHALGVPCVGIEQDPDAVGIAVARRLQVPVVFADARAPGVLDHVHLGSARALMAVTNDDLANLQCGLTAREHHTGLRVVLRIFDAHLAERLDRSVELDLTRSVSALAAPAFAGALLGRTAAQGLTLSSVPLRVLEAPLPAGSAAARRPVGELQRPGALRVLAVDGRWDPRADQPVPAGARLAVVGTREACEALLHPSD